MADNKSHNAQLVTQVRDGERNPFWTVEALGEHHGALRGALLRHHGIKMPDEQLWVHEADGKPGTVVYHLRAAERYLQEVFNSFSALLPDLYAASDGDDEALARMKDHLTALAEKHQAKWDRFQDTFNR